MKVAILHGAGDLRIEDQPLDTDNLQPHEIWVETEITAFKIGTDRGNFEGEKSIPGAPNEFPRMVGDSNVGIVQGVGSEVSRFKVGDRVTSRAHHRSEYIATEPGTFVRVPDEVHSEDAVYAHLYTLTSLCYRKADFRPGENVAVVGVGVLGLGAIAMGPPFGARVAAIANSPIRLEMAERVGAHAGFLSDDPDLKAKLDDFTKGAGIDLVILTANPWPAYRTAMEIVRRSGRVAVISLLGRGEAPLDFNPLYSGYFYDKGVSLIAANGTVGYSYPSESEERFAWNRMCEYLLSLMADGRLEPKRLITHRLHYTEMVKAYEMAIKREKTMLGVIFDWRDASG